MQELSPNPSTQAQATDWIGRSETVVDDLSPYLAARMAATLGQTAPVAGEALPPLWHWAYFQPAVPAEGLGTDGHPARGTFLPPAHGRNRMWGGGEFEFHQPLRLGTPAECLTTIQDVSEKEGSTGSLLLVTLRHEYRQSGELALCEWQNLVYRLPGAPKAVQSKAVPPAQWNLPVQPDATLLFRYSAATFNGHRIHYDHPYATEVEGYAGLVVHGPLLATLSVQAFCRAHPEARLRRFRYRGVRPLVLPHAFEAAGRLLEDGKAETWITDGQGMVQKGEVEFE